MENRCSISEVGKAGSRAVESGKVRIPRDKWRVDIPPGVGLKRRENSLSLVQRYIYISAVYRYPGTGDLTQFVRGVLIESERHRGCESDFTEADSVGAPPPLHRAGLD